MAHFHPRIFIGTDYHDAHEQLQVAMDDGSLPVVVVNGVPVLWITHREVIPGAMQRPFYELHVTAWVEGDVPTSGAEAEATVHE